MIKANPISIHLFMSMQNGDNTETGEAKIGDTVLVLDNGKYQEATIKKIVSRNDAVVVFRDDLQEELQAVHRSKLTLMRGG
jgi:hypothetical protein